MHNGLMIMSKTHTNALYVGSTSYVISWLRFTFLNFFHSLIANFTIDDSFIIKFGYVVYIFVSVFATTAANSLESSYACYCGGMRQTCLGDVYSVNWMEDSDQVFFLFSNSRTGHSIVVLLDLCGTSWLS